MKISRQKKLLLKFKKETNWTIGNRKIPKEEIIKYKIRIWFSLNKFHILSTWKKSFFPFLGPCFIKNNKNERQISILKYKIIKKAGIFENIPSEHCNLGHTLQTKIIRISIMESFCEFLGLCEYCSEIVICLEIFRYVLIRECFRPLNILKLLTGG